MEEDMIGFRIVATADNEPDLHTKRGFPARAKALLFGAVPLLLLMSGCGRTTPRYSGPPDTVIPVLMKKWAIQPARIVIPQGARVELIVSTADIEHGMAVPGLGINEPVQPGKPAAIRFLAKTPGVYPMHCSIACGRGHDQMTGAIVIEASPRTPYPQ
ncbi:MAG TPA: cupredoxin domain-containing protein [Acidobacteriaceae bacterium]|nr:cupredoxin domain-containing protein [Acidobacteriaceae bacterium]